LDFPGDPERASDWLRTYAESNHKRDTRANDDERPILPESPFGRFIVPLLIAFIVLVILNQTIQWLRI